MFTKTAIVRRRFYSFPSFLIINNAIQFPTVASMATARARGDLERRTVVSFRRASPRNSKTRNARPLGTLLNSLPWAQRRPCRAARADDRLRRRSSQNRCFDLHKFNTFWFVTWLLFSRACRIKRYRGRRVQIRSAGHAPLKYALVIQFGVGVSINSGIHKRVLYATAFIH